MAKTESKKQTLTKLELQEKLSAKFPTEDVKQREGGRGMKLDYIDIATVYHRMNEIFPLGYDWKINNTTFAPNEKSIIVHGTLTVKLEDGSVVCRDGIGADTLAGDTDKSVKTAMAEAFKKATHTLGVALYLWNEDDRLEIARDRKKQEGKSRNFAANHLAEMKKIRDTHKIDTDDKLNALVKEWDPKMKTKNELNVSNIEQFITWLKTVKYAK